MKEKLLYGFNREVKHYEGLSVREGASCKVRLTNYNLQICDIKNSPIHIISLKDISNIAIISDKELIEKDKNVIARGIVGNVLFGGAGLILGGLSGLQKKQVVQNIDYLIINYKSNGEDKVISLYANEGVIDKNFLKGVNKAIEMSKQELKCPYCNNDINFTDLKCPNCGKLVRGKKELKAVKIIVGFFVGFLVLMIVIAMTAGGGDHSSYYETKIKNEMNISEESAKDVYNILKDVGLENFDKIKADSDGLDGFEGAGSKGYRIKAKNSGNIIIYLDSNNNVICIRYADKDYYRNGNVLNKFE